MRRLTIEVHGADADEMARILNYWFPPMGFPDNVHAGAEAYVISHEAGLPCDDECDHCTPPGDVTVTS